MTMLRKDIINALIEKVNAKTYLEIGVDNGINFSEISCDHKIGVDPNLDSPATLHLTSDEFFDQNKETFDVIFIDGLHHADQVYKDILNSLEVLNPGGYIVCHDMNPWEESCQIIPYVPPGAWTGDCWKAFVKLRMERTDLEMFVVDTDCGCAVIKRGSQDLLDFNENLSWNALVENRTKWLNLISVEEFSRKINNANITRVEIPEQVYFRVNHKPARRPAMWIVDDFYANPHEIREYALQQEYFDDPGYIGRRTRKQYFFPGIKEAFEDIMGMTITEWESHGMNGRFQHNWAGEKLVYHCDFQKWAGMIYLTPDAPFECGTSLYAHRKTRVRHNTEPLDEVFPADCNFLDKTPYQVVDVAGNVFNRLVIFNGGCIHAASEYFGNSLENCRLWHMFFFDTVEDNHNINQ